MPTPSSALVPLAALAAAALAGPAQAPACRGEVAGAVTARFACVAEVVTTQDGRLVFAITPRDTIPDVPAYRPAAFELPSAPAPGTYALADLGMGMASLAVEGGAMFTATKTSSTRGEVTLTLRSVKPDPSRPGAWIVHGSYRARLVPTSAGRTGEVVFDVTF